MYNNKECSNDYFKDFWNKELSDSFISIIKHLRRTYNDGNLNSQVAVPIPIPIDDNSKYKLKRLIDVPEFISDRGPKYVLKIDEHDIYVCHEGYNEEFQKVYFEKDDIFYLPYEAPTWYFNREYEQEFRNMHQLEAFLLFVDGYTFVNESLKMKINLQNIPEELKVDNATVKLKALGKYYN